MLALTALAFVGYAAAQSASGQDVAVVQANFQSMSTPPGLLRPCPSAVVLTRSCPDAQLVPQLISSFMPQGTLSVNFGGQAISIGQNLSQSCESPEFTLGCS